MSVVFYCACGNEIRTADENAGKRVRCPDCRQMRTVPHPDSASRERQRPEGRAEFAYAPASLGTSGKAVVALVLGIGSFLTTFLCGLPAIVLGIWSLRDIKRSKGRLTGKGLATTGVVLGLLGSICSVPTIGAGLLWWYGNPFTGIRDAFMETASKAKSANNLRQIGIAMSNYEGTNRTFPAGAIYSNDGKPLLSWRVALLPYLQHKDLYKRFHLDEPWDSPHNKPLLSMMPDVYSADPQSNGTGSQLTYYRVFHSADAQDLKGQNAPVFAGSSKTARQQITRGTSNTILVVEAAEAVPWTKPDELPYPVSGSVEAQLGGLFEGGYNVLFADGNVRYYASGQLSDKVLKAAISRDSPEEPFVPMP